MSDEDTNFTFEIVDSRPDRPRTLITTKAYKLLVRQQLLLELANIFDESLTKEWKSFEISDFLESYRKEEDKK